NPFNHMTVMFKKENILKVGNYRKVLDIGFEDYDLWIRLLINNFKVKNIPESLVKVRAGQAMMQRRSDKKRLKTGLYFRKNLYDLGFINFFEFIVYSMYTILFSFSPIFVKKILYKNILRKN